jgi:hypothetical protein
MIGGGVGLAAGMPGLGLVGNAIGTGIDTARANASIGPGGQQIGLGGYLSGLANNASFGMLGNSIGAQWGNEMGRQSAFSYGPGGDPQSGYGSPVGPGYVDVDQTNAYSDIGLSSTGSDVGGGGSPGSSVDSGVGGGSGEVSGEGAPGGYAKGGHVTRGRLIGPNPPGPDDGYAALDHGEFVIKASDVKKLGGPERTRAHLAKLLAG